MKRLGPHILMVLGVGATASAGVVNNHEGGSVVRSFKTLTAERQTEMLRALEAGGTRVGYENQSWSQGENVSRGRWVDLLWDLQIVELEFTPSGQERVDPAGAVLSVRDLVSAPDHDSGLRIAELIFGVPFDTGLSGQPDLQNEVFDSSSWGWRAQGVNWRNAGLASRVF